MSALRPIMAKGAASSPPLDLVLEVIPSLPRPLLARMVAKMIDRLDAMDGDTDIEPNGDEQDGGNGEDDFGVMPNWILGPGCPIADPDLSVDDDGCDESSETYRPLWASVAGRAERAIRRERLGLPPDRC